MKYRFLLVSILALLQTLIPAFGQTGLYSYDGGYFLRNGSHWEEYRPAERHEVWNEYEQVKTTRRILDSVVCARRCLCRGMVKLADINITCTVDGPATLSGNVLTMAATSTGQLGQNGNFTHSAAHKKITGIRIFTRRSQLSLPF